MLHVYTLLIGIEIHDTLHLFTGDHPATSFEMGTQMGGGYPCGGCGIRGTMIDDQAHALRLPTRSTSELQNLATKGFLGKVHNRNMISV